jgi:hypothetical protein
MQKAAGGHGGMWSVMEAVGAVNGCKGLQPAAMGCREP